MRSALAVLVSLIPWLGGCYQWGEADYLGFAFKDFADPWFEFRSGDQLLLGSTRLCVEIAAVHSASSDETQLLLPSDAEQLRACFDEAVSGPASLDADGCLNFTAPGEVAWELTPDTCGEQVERMRFTLVEQGPDWRLGFDEHHLRFAADPELQAELGPIKGLAPGRSASELAEPPDAARHVIAGQIDVVVLRFDNAAGRVYWSSADAAWEIIGSGIDSVDPDEYSSFAEWAEIGLLTVRMSPTAQGRVRGTLPGGVVYESPELIAVTQDAAVSLDLVTAGEYLFADVRDADGNLLHAVPIEWSLVEGAIVIEPGELDDGSLFTREYASFRYGNCEPAGSESETRHAVVRARLGELEDTVEVEYVVEPSTKSDPAEPDEACLYADPSKNSDPEKNSGCACTTDDRAPTAPMFAVVGLVALVSRRNRVACRS